MEIDFGTQIKGGADALEALVDAGNALTAAGHRLKDAEIQVAGGRLLDAAEALGAGGFRLDRDKLL